MSDLADDAVRYILHKIKSDPRLGYYFGDTEGLRMLVNAAAVRMGLDPEKSIHDFNLALKTEAPICKVCGAGHD